MLEMTHKAYIGAGSNMGDRLLNLRKSRDIMDADPGIEIIRVSGVYNTEPYGDIVQDDFLNCVFEINTMYKPFELLNVLLGIESKLKRVRTIRWGPRTIDLDILFYDTVVLNNDNLIIPHRELHKRLFVLTPLNDLIPEYVHPVINKTCRELEKKLKLSGENGVADSGFVV